MVLMDSYGGEYDGRAITRTSLIAQIVEVLDERDSKWILGLMTYNIAIICYLCNCITSTNSIALTAYVNMIFFNIFALLVCLISLWVERNTTGKRNFSKEPYPLTIYESSRLPKSLGYPKYRKSFDSHLSISSNDFGRENFQEYTSRDDVTEIREKLENDECFTNVRYENFYHESISSMGLEKYEVIALLVSSCLSLMAGSLVSVEVVARLSEQPRVHTERLGLGALLGFLAHLGTIIGYPDAGLNHVVCKALPCPTLRGCNPILGGNMIGALIIVATHFVIDFWEINIIDTAAAFAVLCLTATSMLPLAFYTLSVILQKLPRHMSEQLDKCLREALTIDGVIEFRNERFWTKSFGKIVRIRRNANETHVLESVTFRLSKIVSSLTIQEFREYRKINDISRNYSNEYYINEILSPLDDNIDDTSSRSTYYRKSLSEIDKDSDFVRIEDIIGTAKIGESKNLSYDRLREKFLTFNDTRKEEYVRVEDKTMRKVTIYDNNTFSSKDRLWRADSIKKNDLLRGTGFDF